MLEIIQKILKDENLEFFISTTEEKETILEVWLNKKKLSIWLNLDGIVEVIRVWGSHIYEEMSSHKIVKANEISEHLHWLKR